MRYLLLILFTIITAFTYAQSKTGSVKGKLADSLVVQPLNATITILDEKDSSLQTYALAKDDGSFSISNLSLGKYLINISHQGYLTILKPFEVSNDKPVYDFGLLYLGVKANDLGNVTVTQAPIVIKGDTTEFNAGSFKTKPNSTAEDLFKKLPGVQVEKDGTVKAQGETVQKVLVDGKKFFGNDPKMATKNLPSDIIDKVQVFDAQSDQSTFSGFDDGNREKTINIITKKDKRKGYFGKASAGAGENERYAANLSANRFNGNQQISILAQANNTNQQNFSMQDILGTMNNNRGGGMMGMVGGMLSGGMASMAGRGGGMGALSNFMNSSTPGIARTIATGINYNDVWGKNTSVSGSYFYNNMNIGTEQDRFTQTLLRGDSTLFSANHYFSLNKNQNHRFNFEIDQKIDSFNTLLVRPSLSYQESKINSETNTNTTLGKESTLLNNVQQYNNSSNKGYNFNNSILWRHRFKKKGRTFSLNLSQALTNSNSNSSLLSYNYPKINTISGRDTLDQLNNIERDGKTFGTNISYTEPVDTKSQLEITYNFNYNSNHSNHETMRYDKLAQKYTPFGILTNNFENSNVSQRTGLSYRRQVDKLWSYTAGMAVQRAELTSINKTKAYTLSQTSYNFFPTLLINYSKNRVNNIRFNYRGNTRQPSATQLQDVIDNTNQLNITRGNPALQQEFTHNFSLFYSKINIFTFKNFLVSLNGSVTGNKIGNANYFNTGDIPIVIDGIPLIKGAQYTKPVNLNGAYNVAAFVNYGFPVKKPRSNINFTTTIVHNRDVNLVNELKSYTRNYIMGQMISYNMNIKEKFDLNFTSSSNYTIAKYSQQPEADGDYFYQVFSCEPTYSTKNGWIFGADLDYTINTGQSAGYNQSIPLLNTSIAKTVFKNKAGEIRLSVFDLLNENKSIVRTVDQNKIEDTRSNVLTRYLMLTFTYNLRKFGQQQMPSMFRMFRRMPGGGKID